MKANKRLVILSGVLLAAAAVGSSAAIARLGFDAVATTQDALEKLAGGQLDQAESLAQQVTNHPSPQSGRAWLVVASARQKRGQHQQAQEAYRAFLETCNSADLREYATDQIRLCQTAQDEAPAAPGSRLTRSDLAELARVQRDVQTESSLHFSVRSRNAKLSKLLVVEAEAALSRICGQFLQGQDYPNIVEINVWTDHKDYLDHASDAPEWSGGSYSLTVDKGVVTRRIDLMQLDAGGRFDTVILDRVLPHEMCHLVMREFFGDAACPLFLNEGLAMLSEAYGDNQRIVLAGTALAGKGKIPLEKLILQQCGDLPNVDVFYAESYSLLGYLKTNMTEDQFKSFIASVKDGCSFTDALNRALLRPHDESLIGPLADAWESHAIEQAQYIRALQNDQMLSAAR